MWYSAEVVSLNNRARSAKVLYATGDVETLSIDEIAAEGAPQRVRSVRCVLLSHWSPYDRVGVVNADP